MEALLIIFGLPLAEALFGLTLLLTTMVGSIVCVALELVGFVLTLFFTRNTPSIEIKFPKRLAAIILGLATFCILFVLSLNFLFFAPTAHFLFNRVEGRSGIKIEAEQIEGNIFTGTFELKNLALSRSGNEKSDFDLKLDRFAVKVKPLSLLPGTKEIEALDVIGLNGSVHRKGVGEKKPRKADYEITRVNLEALDLLITDSTPEQGKVELKVQSDQLTIDDMNSFFTALDILFHSNGTVALEGTSIDFKSTREELDGSSLVSGKALPIHKIKHYFGKPLMILDQGVADIEISNEWKVADKDSHWNLKFKLVLDQLKASLPPSYNLKEKAVGLPIVSLLNARKKPVTLSFKVALNRSGLEFSYSEFLNKVSTSLYHSLTALTAKATGVAKEALLDRDKGLVGKFKKTFPAIKFKKEKATDS